MAALGDSLWTLWAMLSAVSSFQNSWVPGLVYGHRVASRLMRPRAHSRRNSLKAPDFVFSLSPERTGRTPSSALQPPSAADREQVWLGNFRASART